MPTFTVPEAYDLVRSLAESERDLRRRADAMLVARDMAILAFDGDPGVRRAGLAAAAGLSRSRVTFMCNHGALLEDLDESVPVPAPLRDAIEEIRPDLGRIRSLGTRVA